MTCESRLDGACQQAAEWVYVGAWDEARDKAPLILVLCELHAGHLTHERLEGIKGGRPVKGSIQGSSLARWEEPI